MSNSGFGIKKYDGVLVVVITVVSAIILLPMVILRENYIFTIHDYLDSWPSLFEVIRRENIFFDPDAPMPILNGMSTCYLYFDFGIYRCINYVFGFIWGEIVNKASAIFLGYLFMSHMLQYMVSDAAEDRRNMKLLSLAYAITPVYPNWSISFAVLPLLLEVFMRYYRNPQGKPRPRMALFLLFGFFVYFPCIGIFVLAVWGVGMVIGAVVQKRINIRLLVSLMLMTVSSIIFNINVFIYVLRGDQLNRSLETIPQYDNFFEWFFVLAKESARAFLVGQYHAKPVPILIVPVSLVGMAMLLILFRKAGSAWLNNTLLRTGIIVFVLIFLFSFMKGLEEVGALSWLFSKVLSVLKGFNFGRVMYLNNILWYLLFAVVIVSFSKRKEKMRFPFSILIIFQLVIILLSGGHYRDTVKNLFYEKSIVNDSVTYKEFFDEEYFTTLKDRIDYQGQGVVSVGYEPAVAMYNGFNTLDGYLCINSMEYHNAFREIIAPTLEKNADLRESYDTWGGRIYVYCESKTMPTTRNKTVEEKELYINTTAFEKMGGKYIFSRYIISNAADLGLVLIDDFDGSESIYHVFTYAVE